MKQIFDWMREQIDKYSYDTETCGGRYIDIIEEKDAVRLVDKAEAKWEADCCEWKYSNTDKVLIVSQHNPRSALWVADLKTYPYCNCCGKPIKISEVE